MSEETGKIAHCPHCGGDEFHTTVSETKTVRMTGKTKYPYYEEEILSSEGKGRDTLICDKCGRDLDMYEILEEIVPDSVKNG